MYKRLELHNHTNESDAVFTCKELTDFMVADQVDAFALTDHNTISGHCKIKNYLKEHPQPIDFIPGMEYTTYYGHILCLNLTEYVPWEISTDTSRNFSSGLPVKRSSGRRGTSIFLRMAVRTGLPFRDDDHGLFLL